jgi:hypothetical protein
MALYDPGVSINNSIPKDWLPEFEIALKKNDIVLRGNNSSIKSFQN